MVVRAVWICSRQCVQHQRTRNARPYITCLGSASRKCLSQRVSSRRGQASRQFICSVLMIVETAQADNALRREYHRGSQRDHRQSVCSDLIKVGSAQADSAFRREYHHGSQRGHRQFICSDLMIVETAQADSAFRTEYHRESRRGHRAQMAVEPQGRVIPVDFTGRPISSKVTLPPNLPVRTVPRI